MRKILKCSTVTRHDFRDYIEKFWNASENLYRSYKIFIESVHLAKLTKLFEQSIIRYGINKP